MKESKSGESKEALKKIAREKAYNYETQYHCCSQATMLALQEVLGLQDELTLKATSSVCGGMALSGNTCGALSAGVMVMGMKYGRGRIEEGIASVMRGMLPASKLIKWFEREFGTTVCREISGFEMDEDALKAAIENPEAMLEGLDPDFVEKCSQICGKTAEKVVEIVSEESSP